MSKARNFAAMMAVAGGLTAVVAVPAAAVSCCGFNAPQGQTTSYDNNFESEAAREARLAKAKAAREARKAERAAKKAAQAKAAVAAAAPVVATAN